MQSRKTATLAELKSGDLCCLAKIPEKVSRVPVLEVLDGANPTASKVRVGYLNPTGGMTVTNMDASLPVYKFQEMPFSELADGDLFALYGHVRFERNFTPMRKLGQFNDPTRPKMLAYNATSLSDKSSTMFIPTIRVLKLSEE
jgi:hypothetical protein